MNMINTHEQVEAIAREVMEEELARVAFEMELLREELRQLHEGERMVLPTSTEHAEAMFKVSAMYLGYWNPLSDDGKFKFKD
jgi:hypothetical protein